MIKGTWVEAKPVALERKSQMMRMIPALPSRGAYVEIPRTA